MLTTRQTKIKEATRELNFADLQDKLLWMSRRWNIGFIEAFAAWLAIERDQEQTLGRIISTWA